MTDAPKISRFWASRYLLKTALFYAVASVGILVAPGTTATALQTEWRMLSECWLRKNAERADD